MNLFAKVETLNEIFADKLTALAYRPYMKFRDLWDIDWLMMVKKSAIKL